MEKTTKTSSSNHIQLSIMTPTGPVFEGEITEGVFPGESGDLGILPEHTPLLTTLRIGIIKIKKPESTSFELLTTSGGYLEAKDDIVTLLAETAESKGDIDKGRAQQSKERAENRLKQAQTKSGQDIDMARARISLQRALNRLEISGAR